jgi:hypothetical protein
MNLAWRDCYSPGDALSPERSHSQSRQRTPEEFRRSITERKDPVGLSQ